MVGPVVDSSYPHIQREKDEEKKEGFNPTSYIYAQKRVWRKNMAPRSVDVGVERTGSSTCTTSTNRHKPFFLCFFSFFVLSFLILLRGGVNVDGPTDNKDPLRYQLFYSFLESLLVSSLRIEGTYTKRRGVSSSSTRRPCGTYVSFFCFFLLFCFIVLPLLC